MSILPEVETVRESIAATEVDVAFAELDCCFRTRRAPHGGPIAAFWDAHYCSVGWLCENHLKFYYEVKRPEVKRYFDYFGHVDCGTCGVRVPGVDDFAKVWVL